MSQTKLASATEAVCNVAVGYAVAMLTHALVFPLFGFHATTAQRGHRLNLYSRVSGALVCAPEIV